jgi:hypothetical protein
MTWRVDSTFWVRCCMAAAMVAEPGPTTGAGTGRSGDSPRRGLSPVLTRRCLAPVIHHKRV